MTTTEVGLRRGHLVGVLFANTILWVAAILVTGSPLLGGVATVSLLSIGSLLFAGRRRAS